MDGSGIRRKRVIAWGTGPIGMTGLRNLIGHPEYELVGLHAWSPEKIGRDAGTLAGVEPTGIIATNNTAELLALNADCLAYFGCYSGREAECVAEVTQFLEAGTHVVTASLMDLVHPNFGRPEFVEPIVEACEKGNTSVFCGGTDPGYLTTGHLFSLLSGAGRIESVQVAEICNLNGYGSAASMDVWGFNHPLDYRAPMYYDTVGVGWHESTIWGIAHYLGVELDEIVHNIESAAVDFDYEAAWGRGLANTIAAIRWTITGIYKDRPLVIYRKVERAHAAAAPEWEQPLHGKEVGYQVFIKGDPGFDTEMSLGLYEGCAITALHPINAIREVCAAKPGIVRQLDLSKSHSTFVCR